MKKSLRLLAALALAPLCASLSRAAVSPPASGAEDRAYLVGVLTRVAEPVLTAGAEDRLKTSLPRRDWEKSRFDTAPLEAFTRTLAGVAPWIELGPADDTEGRLRARFGDLARRTLINATTPGAKDFMDFGPARQAGNQALVEAAYLAQALLRAPKTLWEPLNPEQRANVLAALRTSRQHKPWDNNWLLFPAIVEAALWTYADDFQPDRMVGGVNKFVREWYRGDGTYPEFRS